MLVLSHRFFYDGVDSARYKLLLGREKQGFEGEISFSQSMNTEDVGSHSDVSYFKGVTRSSRSFEFLLCRWDNSTGQILPMSVRNRMDILDFLIKDHPCEFCSLDNEDIKTYCMFQECDISMNLAQRGYMKVKMIPFSPYSYLNAVYNTVLTNNENKTIEIYNKSNVSPYEVYPIIEYIPKDNTLEYFKIENLNTHQILNVKLLTNPSSKYIIYNYNSFIDGEYDEISGDFIRLKRGVNNLKFTGNGQFVIKVANPVTL